MIGMTLDKLGTLPPALAAAQQLQSAPEVKEYVVGFLFLQDAVIRYPRVVLIQKSKPDWQRGKWNGIGGKIERGETPLDAMRREWIEGTGDTSDPIWSAFLNIDFANGVHLYFFKAWATETKARTTTDEQVRVVPAFGLSEYDVIPNLRWIIPFAMNNETGHLFQ